MKALREGVAPPDKPAEDRVRPLQVAYRRIASLIGYPKNARTHSPAQVGQIAASITAFGWSSPVLIDEHGGIIAGHGRVMAAKKLGMVEVPCITLAGLTPTQRQALVIADNKLALNAGWDEDLLVQELGELASEGFDLGLTGFGEAEIAKLLGEGPEPEAPESEAAAHQCPACGHVWSGDHG